MTLGDFLGLTRGQCPTKVPQDQDQGLFLGPTPALVPLCWALKEFPSKEGPQIPTALLLPTWAPHPLVVEGEVAQGRRSPRCLRLKFSRQDSSLRSWQSGKRRIKESVHINICRKLLTQKSFYCQVTFQSFLISTFDLNVISCSSSSIRSQTPAATPGQASSPGPQGAPGAPPTRFPAPPGMMPPDMQNMGPNHGMNQGPPNMGPGGPPMMGGFAPGDGPPHGGAMPPCPPQGGGNFFNNFFNQQDGMAMEGVVQEGEREF